MVFYIVNAIHARPHGLTPLKLPAVVNTLIVAVYVAHTSGNALRLDSLSDGLGVMLKRPRAGTALASCQHPIQTRLRSASI